MSKYKNRLLGYDIYVIIFVSILAYFGLKDNFIKKNVQERKKYTIGTTTRHVRNGNTYVVEYKYNINGKDHFDTQRNKIKVKVPNGKYIVIYDSLKVENSIILYDKRIKDNIKIPVKGLDQIPSNYYY